jgi:acyl-coenzyme A synthetase/AMP-(fatty) acid ligase
MNPAFIRFTSGTTARSKGVVLSHEATAARVLASDRVLRFTADDRVAWVLPLAYHFAVTMVAYVRAGVHILMCATFLAVDRRDPAAQSERPLCLAASLRAYGKPAIADPAHDLRLAFHGAPIDR